MRYTIQNTRPSVLHIPDAALRLAPGEIRGVETLTPQMGVLLASQALTVVVSEAAPSPVQVVATPVRVGRRGNTPPITEPHHDDE